MLARWVRNPDRFAEVSGADAVGEEHVTGRDAPVEIIDGQGKPLRERLIDSEGAPVPLTAATLRLRKPKR